MTEGPLIVVGSVKLDQAARCYSPLSAPLRVRLEYAVLRPVVNPAWAATFEADIAYGRISVPLVQPTACSECMTTLNVPSSFLRHTPSDRIATLQPGELYQLDVHLETMELSKVEEKYVLQVGMLRLILLSGKTELADVNHVVQVKKNDDGELMRLIMNPLV
ncbi:hypothetical protein TcG_09401 [Trypanosoma cruzi]|uniref:Uncharacterized protein n=1 Tax=Trypanosoma cruzi TaxID=5693 RepID=A0A2V2W379_TRYCR|nr:hypothetical protein TcBrA4_0058690 [Trypanosoma cruzi]PBJ73563.1 hypothetical protein BCY84_14633 [Trypanosoma cruzi cruzi]PWV02795.1 hypothetical protein C4B63_2g544 [Trypanosoma cruzi]RNF09890.1 hypothetical protein TcG_09401 [Trypanosoma cruzi]